MNDLRAKAIALHDAFTHEHRDRRQFMAAMVALTGSVAAAEAMASGIAAAPVGVAPAIDPADPRLVTRKGSYRVGGGTEMTGYFAAPRGARRSVGAVMVIHENRGLNAHIEDVARRVALAGFFAVAPDFLSPQGGTPADEDKAREMIGAADYDQAIAAGVATLGRLTRLSHGNGRAAAIGFCWGGALVNQIAVAAGGAMAAGVSYYGPAPSPPEAPARRVEAAMLLHYAGNDSRVNATGLPWGEALAGAGKRATTHVYPGVDHAFNNDTSAARYNAQAAALAWERTTAFLHAELDAGAR